MKYPTVTVLALTTGNILGPLLVFGGIGWYLTDLYSNKAYVLGGIFIAFIMSNVLILTTTTKYLKSVTPTKPKSTPDNSAHNDHDR